MPDSFSFGWLFQEVIAHWIILALGLGGGTMLAALKKFWPSVADPVLYGAAGFTLVVMLLLSMLQLRSFNTSTQEPPIESQESLEEVLRGWADSFGWGTRPLQVENALIAFQVSLYNGAVRVPIIQSEQLAGFLTIRVNLALSDEEREQFLSLEQNVATQLIRTLRIEMARMGIDFAISEVPLNIVRLEKKLPITPSLAQHEFLATVSQVDQARIVYSQTIGLTLNQGNVTQ